MRSFYVGYTAYESDSPWDQLCFLFCPVCISLYCRTPLGPRVSWTFWPIYFFPLFSDVLSSLLLSRSWTVGLVNCRSHGPFLGTFLFDISYYVVLCFASLTGCRSFGITPIKGVGVNIWQVFTLAVVKSENLKNCYVFSLCVVNVIVQLSAFCLFYLSLFFFFTNIAVGPSVSISLIDRVINLFTEWLIDWSTFN